MVPKKPRVLIIGAGMAGLSAARQLVQAGDSSFDLTLLEASNKIGGRILTSEIGGNRVELGATWIHGMEGSPLYKIAQEIGATMCTTPFERQDGFPGSPVVLAEGGLTIPPSVVSPVKQLYKKLLDHIRSKEKPDSPHTPLSIGSFIAHGLDTFLSQQNTCQLEDALFDCLSSDGPLSWSSYTSTWTVKSLQEAVFAMNEYMERVDTSANTLYDLDLQAEKEYKDYPGEHVTIPGGYMSIINELASCLPEELIQFGKMVEKIVWNRELRSCAYPVAVYCSDGSVFEADHVIITVSLGVLKAGVLQGRTYAWDSLEGRHVCRSVDELLSNQESVFSLFEPPLPACKVEAISRLGYGLVNKVFLQLNTNALSPSQLQQLNSHIQLVYKSCKELKGEAIPWWMRKTFSLSPIYDGSCVLLCWFAGSEALELESLSDEEIMSGVARTLASFGMVGRSIDAKRSRRRVMRDDEYSSSSDSEDILSREDAPSSSSSSDSEENFEDDETDFRTSEQEDYRKVFTGILRSSWGRDPLFHGSYSFVATGASGDDIEKLAEPLPELKAGEFCGSADASSNKDNAYNAINAAFIARDGATNAHGEACNATCGPCEHKVPCNLGGCSEKDVGGNAPLQLLFAGEATVRALYSTTHGAHLSGLREANRLLNHYALAA